MPLIYHMPFISGTRCSSVIHHKRAFITGANHLTLNIPLKRVIHRTCAINHRCHSYYTLIHACVVISHMCWDFTHGLWSHTCFVISYANFWHYSSLVLLVNHTLFITLLSIYTVVHIDDSPKTCFYHTCFIISYLIFIFMCYSSYMCYWVAIHVTYYITCFVISYLSYCYQFTQLFI